jgi:hypothetical protein
MVTTAETVELPTWYRPSDDPVSAYERHFGALPVWVEDLSGRVVLSLARQALRAGVPLTPVDNLS